ncbi:hypothetical protein [Salinisphaera japonica]|uniref:hypothetical protein n=1 Tax=Salinisphaera japonica TaxID=1304270 RepID=UPI000F4B2739|nr:hypothetical protein [Salinisphaera japonica]|tara:strand:- start:1570 stop:1773 length:204 start_codon:yes stop_codon:yes gene_type:complete
MSVWTTLLSAGREMTVVTERVDRLRAEVDALHQSVTANTERLIRIETLIDLARERQREIPTQQRSDE